MRKYPILFVEWIDAHSEYGWHEFSHVQSEPDPQRSVGFLIRESENTISIAQSHQEEGSLVADVLTIPRSYITSIKKLRHA